jgi:hypothetical protein
MTRWMTGLFLLSLCTYGCQHAQNNQAAAVQEQPLAKPIVAVVPVIDHSHSELGWNLSEELTHSISARLLKHDQIYLANPEKVQASVRKLKETQDPFSSNLSWVKRAFSQNEFVVFMELVEHKEYPLHTESDSQDSPAELSIAMRVRVVDIRGSEPKIVLQELLQDSQHIPRQFTRANFDQVPWGADTFDISPVGMAHAQLTKELASRLEDYILLSEQR